VVEYRTRYSTVVGARVSGRKIPCSFCNIFFVPMKNFMFLRIYNMFCGVKTYFVMWMKNFTLPHSYPQTLNPPFIIVGVYLSGRTYVCVCVCVVIVHLCEGNGCVLWLLCLHGASLMHMNMLCCVAVVTCLLKFFCV
jgi:hypothetical protein